MAKARTNRPAVLFFDEVAALGFAYVFTNKRLLGQFYFGALAAGCLLFAAISLLAACLPGQSEESTLRLLQPVVGTLALLGAMAGTWLANLSAFVRLR